MKKIYITGLAGMLGSNLAFLLRDEYLVYGVDLIKVKMPEVEAYVYDILDEDNVREQLLRIKPDVLIHTVAAVNVDLCEKQKDFAKQLNERSTDIVAKVCHEIGTKVIYISTDAVFDPVHPRLSQESDEVNPKNEYAKTKLAGEKYVLQYPENLVLRTNIYGFNVQNKNSFGEWVLSSLLKGETLKMFDDIYFSPILVNDLAMVIKQCIQNDLCGLYHACGTGAVNKYEFGIMLKEEFQITTGAIVRTSSDTFSFQAPRSKYMGMSNEKLKNALGIKIRTPKESIAYFKELYDCNYQKVLKEFGGITE
ncbi:MAG: SDR family oxidoreductase [Clostridiales bacterium]|nr:SDR family oxidoreductase [Clostridiales bacterium]